MKYKFPILILASMLAVALFMAALNREDGDGFLENRAIITVRSIGHELLLATQDSTSRILPVKQLSRGIFQLEFQNDFGFMPDNLVKIVGANLEKLQLPLNYLVNVFDCKTHEMVYAFEINPNRKDIIPCLGRVQPVGCYSIQIAFVDMGTKATAFRKYTPYAAGMVALALLVLVGRQGLTRKSKETNSTGLIDSTQQVVIGNTHFFPTQLKLVINRETIELSKKETQLLEILAAQPNELISRERLLKQVWEDAGVFTGRSLDMFISKLRKKLKADPSLAITNVHGQGYKLEVSRNGGDARLKED
jgi:DNA-binding winged helix-turn-helix (wHTH) protein